MGTAGARGALARTRLWLGCGRGTQPQGEGARFRQVWSPALSAKSVVHFGWPGEASPAQRPVSGPCRRPLQTCGLGVGNNFLHRFYFSRMYVIWCEYHVNSSGTSTNHV